MRDVAMPSRVVDEEDFPADGLDAIMTIPDVITDGTPDEIATDRSVRLRQKSKRFLIEEARSLRHRRAHYPHNPFCPICLMAHMRQASSAKQKERKDEHGKKKKKQMKKQEEQHSVRAAHPSGGGYGGGFDGGFGGGKSKGKGSGVYRQFLAGN